MDLARMLFADLAATERLVRLTANTKQTEHLRCTWRFCRRRFAVAAVRRPKLAARWFVPVCTAAIPWRRGHRRTRSDRRPARNVCVSSTATWPDKNRKCIVTPNGIICQARSGLENRGGGIHEIHRRRRTERNYRIRVIRWNAEDFLIVDIARNRSTAT